MEFRMDERKEGWAWRKGRGGEEEEEEEQQQRKKVNMKPRVLWVILFFFMCVCVWVRVSRNIRSVYVGFRFLVPSSAAGAN